VGVGATSMHKFVMKMGAETAAQNGKEIRKGKRCLSSVRDIRRIPRAPKTLLPPLISINAQGKSVLRLSAGHNFVFD